jgi:signal transduction histidine kinase
VVAPIRGDVGGADDGGRQLDACRFEMVVSPAAPIRLTAIYRIIHEALTDATKYGHATRAATEPPENATTVELGVRDDGGGLDPATSICGVGLLGVRERVQLLHATVRIGGITITASFPAQRRPATAATAAPGSRPPNRYGCGRLR